MAKKSRRRFESKAEREARATEEQRIIPLLPLGQDDAAPDAAPEIDVPASALVAKLRAKGRADRGS
jgi:hypothetical protein